MDSPESTVTRAAAGNRNALIDEVLATSTVRDADGREYQLHSHVTRGEGEFLAGLVRSHPHVRRSLEIGFAYGISALFICRELQEIADARHTVVDPFQSTQWNGVGINNLRRMEFDRFDCLEKPSEIALPELLRSGQRFDFVLIDGWHTFDHTLVDAFYATKMLDEGGLLVFDDANMPAVQRVIAHLATYPCFERHAQCGAHPVQLSLGQRVRRKVKRMAGLQAQPWSVPTMVALRKVAQDSRDWDWHESF